MQIDWITVAAQVVNFLVLVWLLHRFLYGPITRAMDRRERHIANRLQEADEMMKRAEDEAQAFRDKQEELGRAREGLLSDARDQADQLRRDLQDEVRIEMENRRTEWLAQLEDEERAFLDDIREMATRYFYDLARRALRDLANAELEDQIAAAFLNRLQTLEDAARMTLAEACKTAGGGFHVRSVFELPADRRRQITRAIHNLILADTEVTYEQSEEIGLGIELRSGGQAIRWSLESYIDRLQEELAANFAVLMPTSEQSARA